MCPDCNDLMSRLGRKPAVPFEGEPNSAMYNRSFRRRVQLGVIDAVRSAKRLGVKAVGGSNKRRMSERELIRMSSLFDPDWYLLTYPDVARTGTDPLAHYVDHGWREGRDPGPEFETSAYLRANPDVARSGVNPLLHYIEFGHAEGRNVPTHRPLLPSNSPSSFEFSKANECASFPLTDMTSVAWRRSYRLSKSDPGSVVIGDCVVGVAEDASERATADAAFDLLALLSGSSKGWGAHLVNIPFDSNRLIDAWFLNSLQLRTRWRARKFPLVVRAYQHDPLPGGGVSLVGESLVWSPIDIVDLHLNNAFFPLLFAFAEPTGKLRGVEILAFPSLCRGGAHYAESIAIAGTREDEDEIDQFECDHFLTDRLFRLLRGEAKPVVSKIAVNLDGADGTGRLFQPDMQLWLERVVRVGVVPSSTTKLDKATQFLASAVRVEPSDGVRRQGATLALGPDMVPTIAALTASYEEPGSSVGQVHVPLLVAQADPAQPTLLIELPAGAAGVLEALPGGIANWPHLKSETGLPDVFPVGAIRFLSGLGLTDAELVAPLADLEALHNEDRRHPITWLLHMEKWEDEQLAQAVQSLALQDGSSGDLVVLIGSTGRSIASIAKAAFPGRVGAYPSLAAAAQSLKTPLTGFVAPGIILHNNQTAALFSAFLRNEAVATVGCPLISVEQIGKGWHAWIADAGASALLGMRSSPGEASGNTTHLWRTNFPVATPSSLWMARSSNVANWIGQSRPLEVGMLHICTALVTASCLGRANSPPPSPVIPSVPENRVTKLDVLYG